MFKEFEDVVLAVDLPNLGLEVGDVGRIVMVYDGGTSFEVEFMTLKGVRISLTTLPADAIRPATSTDMPNVRLAGSPNASDSTGNI